MTRQEQLSCLTDRPCAVCNYHSDNGCTQWKCVFEKQPEIEQPCGDAISRQAAIDAIENTKSAKSEDGEIYVAKINVEMYIQQLPSVSTEKTDTYKQGWHDAITTALKETHNIRTDYGIFRVVQEETLIGVGMAYEQVSTEKTGHWITQWNPAHQKEYYYCSECREEYSYDGETGIKINNYKFCPNCGCRMVEPKESENDK